MYSTTLSCNMFVWSFDSIFVLCLGHYIVWYIASSFDKVSVCVYCECVCMCVAFRQKCKCLSMSLL